MMTPENLLGNTEMRVETTAIIRKFGQRFIQSKKRTNKQRDI